MSKLNAVLGRFGRGQPAGPKPTRLGWEYLDGVNPDSIRDGQSVTIIYKLPDGPLFTAPYPTTHNDMYAGDPKVRAAVFGAGDPGHVSRTEVARHAILARVDGQRSVISIWNVATPATEGAVARLVTDLAKKGLVRPDARVVMPGLGAVAVDDLISTDRRQGDLKVGAGHGASFDDWPAEIRERLHLLPPQLKRQVLGMIEKRHLAPEMIEMYFRTGDTRYLYPSWRATSEGVSRAPTTDGAG